METINNLANSAAKAVWGDSSTSAENVHPGTETTNNETQGTEPVSGKLGDTSKGEPFDAGNMESGATSDVKQTEGTTADDTNQSKGPTAEHPSTTGDTGFKAAQADVRDPDTNLTANPETEKERKNVDDTGDLDKSENPDKVDGPGPKPIDEVARERGGDAGAGVGVGAKESKGGGAEDGDGPGAESKGEGTGEQYVKSTGLAADGGDFDATKPGAGREADRLLGEKGYANPATEAVASNKDEEHDKASSTEKVSIDKASTESPDPKEKKHGLKEKIKAKLHKN